MCPRGTPARKGETSSAGGPLLSRGAEKDKRVDSGALLSLCVELIPFLLAGGRGGVMVV